MPKYLATKDGRKIFLDSEIDAKALYYKGWYIEDLITKKEYVPCNI